MSTFINPIESCYYGDFYNKKKKKYAILFNFQTVRMNLIDKEVMSDIKLVQDPCILYVDLSSPYPLDFIIDFLLSTKDFPHYYKEAVMFFTCHNLTKDSMHMLKSSKYDYGLELKEYKNLYGQMMEEEDAESPLWTDSELLFQIIYYYFFANEFAVDYLNK